ncbi:MAG: GAF domain-containing sensor histidine kinase [Anaerolineae bacterium]|nr:MAG: GAF domain-containing sensor histidine kinase [Anaerolineae bacterium]
MVQLKNATGELVDQYVEQKRMLGQFARLVEISLTLNSTLDPNRLLNFIIDTGTDILECEGVSVLLYNEKTGELRFAASTGSDPEELAKIPVPLDSSIAGAIFQLDRPEIINEMETNPQHFQEVGKKTQFVTRNLVGVPMKIGEKTIGVLEGVNKRLGEFTKEDVDILSVIASQAAVAINNARLLQSLQTAYDELAQLDRKKSDFIAIASHELRIPLNTVLGYAEILREDAPPELAQYAERLSRASLQLRALVDDMTNMNLLSAGTNEFTPTRLAIQRIAAEAYKEAETAAKQRGHTYNIRLPKTPIEVNADGEKLKRAILNVLNNAVRFTPNGGVINLVVTTHPEGALVAVQDTGIGLPAQELERIFDEFYQVEGHMTRAYGGMGLGLAISRAVVRLHGGRIWAESEGPDKGSVFYIIVPLADGRRPTGQLTGS